MYARSEARVTVSTPALLGVVGTFLIAGGMALLAIDKPQTSALYAAPTMVSTNANVLAAQRPASFVARGPAASAGRTSYTAMRAGEDPKLTRESEPDDYWVSEAEKGGKSPFSDPMAWAALSAIFIPLIILVIGFATGFIETS